MTNSLEQQIDAFRCELDGLAAIDSDLISEHVLTLSSALLTAPTHELAAVELRELYERFPDDRSYAAAVIVSALSVLSLTVLLSEPMERVPGLLQRLQRLAYAARGLGVAVPATNSMKGGA